MRRHPYFVHTVEFSFAALGFVRHAGSSESFLGIQCFPSCVLLFLPPRFWDCKLNSEVCLCPETLNQERDNVVLSVWTSDFSPHSPLEYPMSLSIICHKNVPRLLLSSGPAHVVTQAVVVSQKILTESTGRKETGNPSHCSA